MPRSAKALINPSVLKWAREFAGMSMNEASGRMHMPAGRIETWETGSESPTVVQLRKLAKIYHQPLAAFYLPSPPDITRRILRDFRRVRGQSQRATSSDLTLDIQIAADRRAVALELYAERRESPPTFEFTASSRSNSEALALRIRDLLGISSDKQFKWRDPRVAFNAWRAPIESLGVLVFQATGVPVAEMRGYSVAELPLPIIVVNRKDTYGARSFTLLHEFTHLALRVEGICDPSEEGPADSAAQRIEVFCNRVAGAALVPLRVLLSEVSVPTGDGPRDWSDDEIETLAGRFGVSREVVLRRLLIAKLTTERFYKQMRRKYQEDYESRPKSQGFISPRRNALSALGKPFVRLVIDALHAGKITTSDVSDYLGIRVQHLGPLVRDLSAD